MRLPSASWLLGVALLVFVAASVAAQSAPPGPLAGPTAPPLAISMSVVEGEVVCRPPSARLPARTPLELLVGNGSERPLWFIAPLFFAGSDHIESGGFTLDLKRGGFLVAPASTVRVRLRTPEPGEFYYSCHEPGQVPRAESSGFLLVVPAA